MVDQPLPVVAHRVLIGLLLPRVSKRFLSDLPEVVSRFDDPGLDLLGRDFDIAAWLESPCHLPDRGRVETVSDQSWEWAILRLSLHRSHEVSRWGREVLFGRHLSLDAQRARGTRYSQRRNDQPKTRCRHAEVAAGIEDRANNGRRNSVGPSNQ